MKSNSSIKRGPVKLAQDIYTTTDEEIFCDTATDLIIRCADTLYSDSEARTLYPQLFHHFRVCSNCADDYKVNMELARLEAAGQLEQPPVMLPMPPLPQPEAVATNSESENAWDKLASVFTRFADVITRGAKVGEGAIILTIASTDVEVTLIANPDATNRELRSLYCNVGSLELNEELEGALIWLQPINRIEILQEQTLDENGDTTFSQLSPGSYDLHWMIAGQAYAVVGIEIS